MYNVLNCLLVISLIFKYILLRRLTLTVNKGDYDSENTEYAVALQRNFSY